MTARQRSRSLFGLLSCGVQDDGQWSDPLRFHIAIHQEAFAVLGNVIAENVSRGDHCAAMKLEKRRRGSGRERSDCAHWNRRQHSRGSEIEDLFAITTPARLRTTTPRNLPFASCSGKGGDINLPATRFVRCVRNPLAVWGNHAV